MRVVRIGVIAEDVSDVEVVVQLLRKLTRRRFSTSHFIGKGCGSIKKKALGWCRAFHDKGCVSAVLVHDRDRHTETQLRMELERVVANAAVGTTVVIPVEELEAWLLADCQAIKQAMNLAEVPPTIASPESVPSPKERLASLVEQFSRSGQKKYVNTVHNTRIAEFISVAEVSKRCLSFSRLQKFAASTFTD